MENLPAEVIHLICQYLSQEQAAVVRLVSRKLSQVASYYLVDSVHFHTSQVSFDRLQLLSDHPIFNQTVTTVIYEACTIGSVGCRHSYFEHFEEETHHAGDRPLPPPTSASQRAKRLFERNMRKYHQNIADQWDRYVDKFQEQQQLLTTTTLNTFIGNAMSKFVHVNKLIFSPMGKCQHTTSRRFLEEFGRTCALPLSANPWTTPIQLRPLLLPQGHVNTALRSISIDSLSPRFFSQESARASIVDTFKQLTHIDLVLKIYPNDVQKDDINANAAIRNLLKSGILKDSLSAAQGLKHLSIGVRGFEPCTLDGTQHVLGQTVWPELTHLDLESLTMTQAAFLDLLKRQPELQGLDLLFMELCGGSWLGTLSVMRKELDLENFAPWGYLQDDDEIYGMDLLNEDDYANGCKMSLADALCTYVCEDKDLDLVNPLVDFHTDFQDPEFLAIEYGSLDDDLDDLAMIDIDSDDLERIFGLPHSNSFDLDDSDIDLTR